MPVGSCKVLRLILASLTRNATVHAVGLRYSHQLQTSTTYQVSMKNLRTMILVHLRKTFKGHLIGHLAIHKVCKIVLDEGRAFDHLALRPRSFQSVFTQKQLIQKDMYVSLDLKNPCMW